VIEARHVAEAEARDDILDVYAELCPGIIDNPYLAGHWPLPMQWMFLRGHMDYPTDDGGVFQALYGGAAGGGKALPVHPLRYAHKDDRIASMTELVSESNVLTPHGWKPIGDIVVGGQVCNPDGTVARVTSVHYPGVKKIYRITMADGSVCHACDEHLWAFSEAGKRKRRKAPAVDLSVLPDSPIRWNAEVMQRCRIGTTADLERKLSSANATDFRSYFPQLPMTRPVKTSLAQGRWPKLSPYTIGALLGDGCITKSARISLAACDGEILDRMEREAPSDVTYRRSCSGKLDSIHYHVSIKPYLERDGLLGRRSHDKFIPKRLIFASIEDRWALAQGLFDTDGYMDERGHIEYVSVSKELAVGVQALLRSLGFRATLTEKDTYYEKDGERVACRRAYRLYVQGDRKEKLFYLGRKVANARKFNGNDVMISHRIHGVDYVGEQAVMCITVDNPNHLFITDDYIVTHNSDCLLMAAAQFLDKPEYAGIIFRRTFTDLALPGAIMDRALSWWKHIPGVRWDGQNKTFTFPSGAKISFAYMQHSGDEYRYQGAEFQFAGWDELTQFPDRRQYTYLLSRIRRPANSDIPLRSQAATNPGGAGHSWVAEDFDVELDGSGYPFYPARIQDNPHIDREAYIAGLMHLHPTTRAQLLAGDWRAREPGDYFRREWFGPLLDPETDLWPSSVCRRVRWWDLAASVKEGSAHTAGVKMARHIAGVYAVEHCASFKATPGQRDARIVDIAKSDGKTVTVGLEIEPGSGGIAQVEAISEKLKQHGLRCVYARPRSEMQDREKVYVVRAPSSGNGKAARCDPVAACLERGYSRRGEGDEWDAVTQARVPWWGEDEHRPPDQQKDGIRLFAGDWTQAYLDIVEGFPGDGKQRVDEADATSGAWAWLKSHPAGETRAPRRRASVLVGSDELRNMNPSERPAVSAYGKDRGGRWRP